MNYKPEIRFPHFKDNWERHSIGNIADVVSGGTPSTSESEYWKEEIPWITPKDMGKTYVNKTEKYISKKGLQNSLAKMLPPDRTILFTSRVILGKSAILKIPAASNQSFQSLVVHEEHDPYFVYTMTDKIKEKAQKNVLTSTVPEISGKSLKNLSFFFPTKEEEETIGKFYQCFDSVLFFLEKQIVEMKSFKKVLLQEMFPHHGEDVPKLRFPEFHGKWKKVQFGDVAYGFDYGINTPSKSYDGKTRFIRVSDIDNEFHTLKNDDIVSPETENNHCLEENDILLARTGFTVGKSYLHRSNDCSCFAGYLIRIKTKEDAEFIFQNTLTSSYFQYIKKITSFSSTISAKEFKEYSFYIPSLEEQKRISTFLRHIDLLIQNYSMQLKHLKTYKNGLKQKML